MKYAEVRNADNVILRERDIENYTPAPHKYGLDKETRIIPVIIAANPTIDADTERLGAFDVVITDDNVTKTRSVLAISAEDQASAAELIVIKGIYTDLSQGNGTNIERLVRIEKVLARLLKDTYGQ